MTWDEFDSEMRKLANTINYRPDIVVGIARGGVIPAALLAKYLGVKDMFVLKLERDTPGRKISALAMKPVEHRKILLVEDMIETGRSLMVGKKFLEERGAEVKTACLYTMPISEMTPDYFLREIAEVALFPWNKALDHAA